MAGIALRAAQRLPKALQVEWVDGFKAQFSYVWMQDSWYYRPALIHLNVDAKAPEELYTNGNRVKLVWHDFPCSEYSSEFLRDHSRPKPVQAVECPITQKVLTVPWRVLPFWPRAEAFNRGALATMQWPNTCVIPGTMWPQLERIPSLVAIETLAEKARVYLTDGVAALNIMSDENPELFKFLATVPIDYSQDMFRASHPTATMRDGKVVAATFNNEIRKPTITVDQIDRFYVALKTFHMICLKIMTTIHIERGQVLVVDNHQCFVGAPAQQDHQLQVSIFN